MIGRKLNFRSYHFYTRIVRLTKHDFPVKNNVGCIIFLESLILHFWPIIAEKELDIENQWQTSIIFADRIDNINYIADVGVHLILHKYHSKRWVTLITTNKSELKFSKYNTKKNFGIETANTFKGY